MIVCTRAVVLSQRSLRESDRLAALYTESLGKLLVRFTGVDRAHGKLKALAEPMVLGEYRLYLGPRAESSKAVGGSLLSSFPGLRSSLPRLLEGLSVCELLERLTPMAQPNPEKFAMIADCLEAMERGGGPWLKAAFCLRLLESAGFGVAGARVSEERRGLWEFLHRGDWRGVAELPEERALRERLSGYLLRAVERITERPLNAPKVEMEVLGGIEAAA